MKKTKIKLALLISASLNIYTQAAFATPAPTQDNTPVEVSFQICGRPGTISDMPPGQSCSTIKKQLWGSPTKIYLKKSGIRSLTVLANTWGCINTHNAPRKVGAYDMNFLIYSTDLTSLQVKVSEIRKLSQAEINYAKTRRQVNAANIITNNTCTMFTIKQ